MSRDSYPSSTPRRCRAEEVLDLDRRARRRTGHARRARAGGIGLDHARRGLPGAAGNDLDTGHGRDAGERLAAEAERRHPGQLLGPPELAGRVAREGEERVRGRHALAVVADREALESATGETDVDATRPGVE